MFKQVALLASLAAFAAFVTVSSSQAASNIGTMTRVNNLTFSNAVGLPGVTLAAGTYVFESGPGGTNPNIVRVLSSNRQKVLYLGFTVVQTRPKGSPSTVLTFGEAEEGAPMPILAWYPVGSNSGHEFLYR